MAVCVLAQRPVASRTDTTQESSLRATDHTPRLAVVAPVELKRVASSLGFDGFALAQRDVTPGALVRVPGLRSECIGVSNGTARARLRAHPPHGPPALG